MRVSFSVGIVAAVLLGRAAAAIPEKIYGVNLGGWLVLEPWILPQEWTEMGGEICGSCQNCIGSEFSLVKAHPETADAVFDKHWSTFFTQKDVDALKAVGINTVRIPLGYWIVERLVNHKTEFYARGGISHLQRGVKILKDAGMAVILDHHAPPGVQTANQAFAGQCTDDVQFYTPYNYERALVWTAVMTAISHLDPNFESVFSIQAVNEPIMDATQTPGYGGFQKSFVETIRTVEFILGIGKPFLDLDVNLSLSLTNVTAGITAAVGGSDLLGLDVKAALVASVPILVELSRTLDFDLAFKPSRKQKEPLVANFMDVNWQYNDPANPADVANGPMAYDNHLYYSFGGVADANEEAYMISICNLQRVQNDATVGNAPLWFGEWALPTQFNASDEFLYKWADAQKLMYSQGRGWLFWNFKTETSELANGEARQWSYLEGVRLGFLTKDPSKLHDPEVCAPYVGKTYTSTTVSTSTTASASATDSVSTSTTSVATTPTSDIASSTVVASTNLATSTATDATSVVDSTTVALTTSADQTRPSL